MRIDVKEQKDYLKTADLASMTQLADIVVTCTGHPRLITKNMLCEAFDENNKMCGDCDR